jgi:hypothetical protein
VSGGGFFGLQQPGQFDEAYALTVTVPTPSPRVTPTPLATPTATPPPSTQEGVAPPLLPTPGPIEESKTSHDPLATIALLNSVVSSGTYVDSVSGIAFGTNAYRNTCASEEKYCAFTFHVGGSLQHDADPRTSSPIVVAPSNASQLEFAGQSGSFTQISSPAGATPHFVQIAEMIGFQQSDPFYSPGAGTITAFAPLGGVVGHLVSSYGAGENGNVFSIDLLGVRLTSVYGDVFTNVAEQLVLPFRIAGSRGWTFNAGMQTESLSDRTAELQQGLAGSYFAAVYPTAASFGHPVVPAVVRPQTQQNGLVQSPSIPVGPFAFQIAGGFQTGFVTNCAPAPKIVTCATAHDHAGTYAVFVNRSPFAFGVATTASASIPGDLAIATTSRYFGSYVNAPGSVTSYFSFTKCIGVTAAYTNAAFPSGIPLPQRGATISTKLFYPFHNFGVEAGYYNVTNTQNSALNQSGYYTLLRFTASTRKTPQSAGCPP